jgi:hypothetical protein
MGKESGEADKARVLIDRGGLEGGDLVPTEALADDIEPARKRRVPKSLMALPRERGPDDRNERFFRVV